MSLATLKAKVEQLIEKAQNGGEDTLGLWLTRTLVSYKNDTLKEMGRNAAFENQPYLTSIEFPKVWRPFDDTFKGCTRLTDVNLPKAEYIGTLFHQNNISLESVVYPSAKAIYRESFGGCTKLKKVDIGVTTEFMRTEVFIGCTSFDTLILRGNSVSTLSNVNNFNGGAFAEGASGGTIYVPSALIESYKTATNWSILYEADRCNFVAIEGSEYE